MSDQPKDDCCGQSHHDTAKLTCCGVDHCGPDPSQLMVTISDGEKCESMTAIDMITRQAEEIARLRAELAKCGRIALGNHHAFPSDRCSAIVRIAEDALTQEGETEAGPSNGPTLEGGG